MRKTQAALSPSAAALGAVMTEDGPDAARVRKAIHRTQIWNYVTGRRVPSAETIAKLHAATRGRVAASGWSIVRYLARKKTGTEG